MLNKIFRFILTIRHSARRLTAEQKALILSYAELDKDTDGTINGLTQTKSGTIEF